MRIVGILLVVVVGVALGHSPAQGDAPDKATLSEVRLSINMLLDDLLKMKQANAKNSDTTSRKRMAASIDRALARVRAAIAGKKRKAMKKRAFSALLQALGKEPDTNKRLSLLRVKLGGDLVRAEQAVKLVKRFRAEERRIAVAALLWSRLLDVKQRPVLQRAVGGKAAQARLQQKLKFK